MIIFTVKTVNMDAKEIGKMILYHRKISGLSRVECAKLAGMGKTAIYDIEHGKSTVQLNSLMKLLHVMNIKMTFNSPLMKKYEDEKS